MRLIDADELLTDRRKNKYYHLPNKDIAVPIIDIEHAHTVNAIPIPDGATNGDMIKALFSQIKIREHNEFMFVVEGMAFNHETYSNLFFKDWWNAPYNPPKQNLAPADKSGLEYADQPTLQSAT